MDNINQYVKNKILKIILELRKKEYQVSTQSMLRILSIVQNTSIYLDQYIGNEVQTYTANHKIVKKEIPNKQKSCVMEIIPEHEDGKFILVNPILYLRTAPRIELFDCVLYHEICHLLAIGDWTPINSNTVKHITGLLDYEYQYNNEEILQVGEDISDLSDDFNDWVAEKLYEEVEKKKYIRPKRLKYIQKIVDKSEDGDFRKLVGYYFNNDLESIEKALKTKTFCNLSSINQYYKDYKNNENMK